MKEGLFVSNYHKVKIKYQQIRKTANELLHKKTKKKHLNTWVKRIGIKTQLTKEKE